MTRKHSTLFFELVKNDKPDNYRLNLFGDWILANPSCSTGAVLQAIKRIKNLISITIDANKIGAWDARLVSLVYEVEKFCHANVVAFSTEALPEGAGKMLALARAVPERPSLTRTNRSTLFTFLGGKALAFNKSFLNILNFLGEVSLSLARLATGKAQYQKRDLVAIVQKSGPDAIPIISLISLLMGLIIAFVGASQLKLFGAQSYTANIVGIAMVREIGAMMAAVIMCGRTGAAFAAELGAMQANQEIDAFETMGIKAMDFLVLPRVLALILCMPLLCLYADLVGIIGGYLTGLIMFDFTWLEYFQQTKSSVKFTDIGVGLIKSVLFGFIVALTGCLHGIQSGRSSIEVGKATTGAVVKGIVSVVVMDSFMTVIFQRLGI
jgi:phospholipid/cholesterol/gamma-HCH transport system permease protein